MFVLPPVSYYLRDQASAFAWPTLLGIIAVGFAGLLLAPKAGFRDMWDERVSNTRRFTLPAVDGIVYGLVTIVALDLLNPSDVHIAFPASILFYTYGGIFLEILLRLFGLTLLTWVLAAVAGAVKLPRDDAVGFWIANVVVSLYEPMPYIQEKLAETPTRGDPGIWIHWAFEPLFLANLLTGFVYRRFGFLAAVTLRLSFYAIWHVAYGGFKAVLALALARGSAIVQLGHRRTDVRVRVVRPTLLDQFVIGRGVERDDYPVAVSHHWLVPRVDRKHAPQAWFSGGAEAETPRGGESLRGGGCVRRVFRPSCRTDPG